MALIETRNMPKIAKQLTDLAVRKARPRDAAYMLASGGGLHLVVLPSGTKQWLVRFRTPEGKRGNRVIGVYPDMGVADAHKAAEDMHQQVRMSERPAPSAAGPFPGARPLAGIGLKGWSIATNIGQATLPAVGGAEPQ